MYILIIHSTFQAHLPKKQAAKLIKTMFRCCTLSKKMCNIHKTFIINAYSHQKSLPL